MEPDTKLPTDAQRRKLCEMMQDAFVEVRLLGGSGKAQQAADLADAFHNLPRDMWLDSFSFHYFRDVFVAAYHNKYSTGRIYNYLSKLDEIIAMTN